MRAGSQGLSCTISNALVVEVGLERHHERDVEVARELDGEAIRADPRARHRRADVVVRDDERALPHAGIPASSQSRCPCDGWA